MIIISQDKKGIFPMGIIRIIDNIVYYGREYESLGRYKTEGQAREVLQDIIKNYQEGTDIYLMP